MRLLVQHQPPFGVPYEFITRHRRKYSVQGMCRELGVAQSGYYEWLKQPLTVPERMPGVFDSSAHRSLQVMVSMELPVSFSTCARQERPAASIGSLASCGRTTFAPCAAIGLGAGRSGTDIELTSDTEDAFFVFRRTSLGELELEGYATPNCEGHDTFLIGNAKPRGFDVISHWRTALNSDRFDQEDETTVILLAASTN